MKLFSGWVWLLFSVAISLVVVSWAYFHHYSVQTAYASAIDGYTQQLNLEAGKLKKTKDKLAKAQNEVMRVGAEWQKVVEVKTPPATLAEGGVNMNVTPYQLTVDARKFRDSVQKAVAAQLHKGGVKIISGPEIEFPTDDPSSIVSQYFNYPAARFPVCVFELGQVTVEGSFEQIEKHMASWSQMPDYLAVASGLSLEGTSPVLTGRYNLVVLAFIRGSKMPPAAAGGSGGAAVGGFGGGAPSFGGPPSGLRGGGAPFPIAGVPGGAIRGGAGGASRDDR